MNVALTDFYKSTIKSIETTSFGFVGKVCLPKLLFRWLSLFVIINILNWYIYKQISLNIDGHQHDCMRCRCVLYLPWWPLKNCEWVNSDILFSNISSKYLSKPRPALLNLINQLNNYSNKQIMKAINICWTVNYEILNILKNCVTYWKLSLFHSLFALCKKILLNINLDTIAIIKLHIKEKMPCFINIQLSSYAIVHAPTGDSAGAAFLYINNRLWYKPRADLKMYAPGKSESVFIEIICPNSSNLIIRCISQYPMFHIGGLNSN